MDYSIYFIGQQWIKLLSFSKSPFRPLRKAYCGFNIYFGYSYRSIYFQPLSIEKITHTTGYNKGGTESVLIIFCINKAIFYVRLIILLYLKHNKIWLYVIKLRINEKLDWWFLINDCRFQMSVNIKMTNFYLLPNLKSRIVIRRPCLNRRSNL
jgi:hypothetical protein